MRGATTKITVCSVTQLFWRFINMKHLDSSRASLVWNISSSSSSCSWRVRHVILFLDPQDEVGPSISSSVVLCFFFLVVYIVVLVLVVCLCPSFVHVVATFPGTVLFPLLLKYFNHYIIYKIYSRSVASPFYTRRDARNSRIPDKKQGRSSFKCLGGRKVSQTFSSDTHGRNSFVRAMLWPPFIL